MCPEIGDQKLIAVLPAYNEERFIGSVFIKLKEYVDDVIVIDDGSTDMTAIIARAAGAVLVRHPKNMGKGAALNTVQIAELVAASLR